MGIPFDSYFRLDALGAAGPLIRQATGLLVTWADSSAALTLRVRDVRTVHQAMNP